MLPRKTFWMRDPDIDDKKRIEILFYQAIRHAEILVINIWTPIYLGGRMGDLVQGSPGGLRKGADQLDQINADLLKLLKQLENTSSGSTEASRVAGGSSAGGLDLSNRLKEQSAELRQRANLFEQAGNAGTGTFQNAYAQIRNWIESGSFISFFAVIGNFPLYSLLRITGLGNLITPGNQFKWTKINYPIFPSIGEVKRTGNLSNTANEIRNQSVIQQSTTSSVIHNTTAIGAPSHIGSLGLHGSKNARDYIASTDPGTSDDDQQRNRIDGREIRSYGKGKIEWISFDDESDPKRLNEIDEVQKNPRGITMQVSYPESGYRVKYTHIVPSDKILTLAEVTGDELPTTKVKKSFTNSWTEPGEVIGCYNQIGWSTAPHLHLSTYQIAYDEAGKPFDKPIDPDTTDIPQKTLF
jgi:hypothetical protein